jgi:RHS repeat-associated protein
MIEVRKYTGQRLDTTDLYYYGARYYDPAIGRFISADTIVPDPYDPQSLNRYSYCRNNPLRYIDPSGHWSIGKFLNGLGDSILNVLKSACVPYGFYENVIKPIYQLCTNEITWEEYTYTPSLEETWEGIKAYYNPIDERGQGRIAGDIAILILTWKALPSGKAASISPRSPTVVVKIEKFSKYAFIDEGKKFNFTKLGYKIDDSAKLRDMYLEQAGMKFAKGDYRVVEEGCKWTDAEGVIHSGTRIEIDIEIPGQGEATGQFEKYWMDDIRGRFCRINSAILGLFPIILED